MNPPCKGCKSRSVGCHSTCEEYTNWSKLRKEKLSQIYEKKKIERDIISHRFNTYKKIKRLGLKNKIVKGTRR